MQIFKQFFLQVQGAIDFAEAAEGGVVGRRANGGAWTSGANPT